MTVTHITRLSGGRAIVEPMRFIPHSGKAKMKPVQVRHWERERPGLSKPTSWCDQCQSRVTAQQGAACKSPWCKAG